MVYERMRIWFAKTFTAVEEKSRTVEEVVKDVEPEVEAERVESREMERTQTTGSQQDIQTPTTRTRSGSTVSVESNRPKSAILSQLFQNTDATSLFSSGKSLFGKPSGSSILPFSFGSAFGSKQAEEQKTEERSIPEEFESAPEEKVEEVEERKIKGPELIRMPSEAMTTGSENQSFFTPPEEASRFASLDEEVKEEPVVEKEVVEEDVTTPKYEATELPDSPILAHLAEEDDEEDAMSIAPLLDEEPVDKQSETAPLEAAIIVPDPEQSIAPVEPEQPLEASEAVVVTVEPTPEHIQAEEPQIPEPVARSEPVEVEAEKPQESETVVETAPVMARSQSKKKKRKAKKAAAVEQGAVEVAPVGTASIEFEEQPANVPGSLVEVQERSVTPEIREVVETPAEAPAEVQFTAPVETIVPQIVDAEPPTAQPDFIDRRIEPAPEPVVEVAPLSRSQSKKQKRKKQKKVAVEEELPETSQPGPSTPAAETVETSEPTTEPMVSALVEPIVVDAEVPSFEVPEVREAPAVVEELSVQVEDGIPSEEQLPFEAPAEVEVQQIVPVEVEAPIVRHASPEPAPIFEAPPVPAYVEETERPEEQPARTESSHPVARGFVQDIPASPVNEPEAIAETPKDEPQEFVEETEPTAIQQSIVVEAIAPVQEEVVEQAPRQEEDVEEMKPKKKRKVRKSKKQRRAEQEDEAPANTDNSLIPAAQEPTPLPVVLDAAPPASYPQHEFHAEITSPAREPSPVQEGGVTIVSLPSILKTRC